MSELSTSGERDARGRLGWGLLALAVYWVLLVVGTHVPAAWLDGGPVDLDSPGGFEIPYFDKLLHATAYFGLTLLLTLVVFHGRRFQWRQMGVLLMAVGLHALIDELLQSFVPDRSPDAWDWVADMGGAVVAFVPAMELRRRLGCSDR